ncbi:Rac GTPase-activating protein 1 [Armadillidium vulgare]|nr:Rac GTPase-activating protein 1 [Armadillidium vulgare]
MGIYAKMSSENKQMIEFILSTSSDFETSFEEIKGNISNSITVTPKLFKSFLSSEDPCPVKRKTDNSLNDSTRRKSLKFTDCKVNELADIIEENETEMLNIFPEKEVEVTFEDIQTDRCRNSTFIKDISLVLDDNCTSFSEHKSHVQWEKDQVTLYSTVIKSPFRSLKNVSGFIENRRDARKHNFVLKKGKITKRFCSCCDKKIFTKEKCYKCQTCNSVCHEDCSDALPIPCVPMVVFSEKLKIKKTTIADHTPRTSPMVPALIVYCTIEIENRGLDSKGIYRTSGAQKDVVRLKVSKRKGCLK